MRIYFIYIKFYNWLPAANHQISLYWEVHKVGSEAYNTYIYVHRNKITLEASARQFFGVKTSLNPHLWPKILINNIISCLVSVQFSKWRLETVQKFQNHRSGKAWVATLPKLTDQTFPLNGYPSTMKPDAFYLIV